MKSILKNRYLLWYKLISSTLLDECNMNFLPPFLCISMFFLKILRSFETVIRYQLALCFADVFHLV